MGEIIDKCYSEDCPYCKKDEERYEELIEELSQLHNQKSTDPKVLFKSSRNHFTGDYRKILSRQNELFIIACRYCLPWTEKYQPSDF